MLRVASTSLLALLTTTIGCGSSPAATGGHGGASSSSSSGTTSSSSGTAGAGGSPACVGPLDCPPPAACHAAATCESGACVYTQSPAGTACGDPANKCETATCDATGACVSSPKVCAAPPESPELAACAPGQTFKAYLGGACGGSCDPATGACVYGTIDVPCPPASAKLPQKHAYQVVLRNYLASLTAADFDVPAAAVTFDPAANDTHDQLYRLWMGVIDDPASSQPNLPSYAGFRIASQGFLLSTIESQSPIHAMVGRESPVGASLGFYATGWDDPRNPFFGSMPGLRRHFTAAAADLVTMDDCWEKGTCKNKDYLAGALREYGAAARAAHASKLDACVVAAFDAGARRLFERFAAVPSFESPNADITLAALAGLFYIADAIKDPDLLVQAANIADAIMNANCDVAGFCRHQKGGYDASYEGWSMLHLVEGAVASGSPGLRTWVDRFARLKAYSTFPEPDGKSFIGPSHMSPATCAPAALDQGDYHHYTRDTAVAAATAEGRYLAFGGATGAPALPAVDEMKATIQSHLAKANKSAAGDATDTMPAWQERHYPGSQEPGIRLYQPGTYDTFAALAQADDALTRPPFARSGDFVVTLGTAFAAAKFGDLGALIHTGEVDKSNVGSGFGGGALSVMWTKSAGSALLGWNRGSQNTGPAPFDWSEWRSWPTHHVAGTSGGKPFSSARILAPISSFDAATPGSLTVHASGDLASASSAPNGALSASVDYARTFVVSAAGVSVQTSLMPQGAAPQVEELHEILPVLLDSSGTAPMASVSFEVMGGGTVPATTAATANVKAVVIARFGASVRIELETPRSVKMTGADVTSTYQWSPVSRNILIALVDAPGPMPAVTIKYLIKPG